jgi:hypothetical protein
MTPEAQRIVIAEACGIEICTSCNHQIDPELCWCGCLLASHGYESGHPFIPSGCTCSYEDADKRKLASPDLPDYLNDLNAMHEAEKIIMRRGNISQSYYWKLLSVCDDAEESAIVATAEQRAEAFLRTLNLWKD